MVTTNEFQVRLFYTTEICNETQVHSKKYDVMPTHVMIDKLLYEFSTDRYGDNLPVPLNVYYSITLCTTTYTTLQEQTRL